MNESLQPRREFLLNSSAALAAGVVVASGLNQATAAEEKADPKQAPVPAADKRFLKAVKYDMVQLKGATIQEKFALLKKLGFDGVELSAPNSLPLEEVLAARDQTGLPIHGVVDSDHWKNTLGDPNPDIRAAGVKSLERALRDAKAYGATSVLLVPCRVNKEISYADAYTRSQAEIRKVLPLAAELQIKIGLENVWNGFLLSPLETARYIDEFESPWIGAYFDVGNVVNYGWPEHWIRILNKRIIKLDIKEYSRKKRDAEGPGKGFDVELLEGDCDWPAVIAALKEIDFKGWGTAEIRGGGPDRMQQIAQQMDKIFAL